MPRRVTGRSTSDDAPHCPPAMISLPASQVALLVDLLTDLDHFLRSGENSWSVRAALRDYAAGPCRGDATYLIDMVGLHAAQLRALVRTDEARHDCAVTGLDDIRQRR